MGSLRGTRVRQDCGHEGQAVCVPNSPILYGDSRHNPLHDALENYISRHATGWRRRCLLFSGNGILGPLGAYDSRHAPRRKARMRKRMWLAAPVAERWGHGETWARYWRWRRLGMGPWVCPRAGAWTLGLEITLPPVLCHGDRPGGGIRPRRH
ncbi:dolichol phosphate-mannose biosynthesis regulatory protein isoform X1 [Tupaia chinensis]|uniref:dolichol phosphate-mannose biosynthesis regulatory protein isoform X1 n=1 Tax=Tupaia chinensis TaxID=246437 RepID=UPI0007047A4D|nr:dolichol phosphate-mannose biosynthesis regulatory protein isoform X1 [Tupaia chinensis]